jgi:ribosomal protein L21E
MGNQTERAGHVAATFKIGDRVRIGPDNGGYRESRAQGLFPGNTGVIVSFIHPGRFGVKTDKARSKADSLSCCGDGWPFFADEIELVAEGSE